MKGLDYFIGNWGMIITDIPYVYIGASVSDLSKVDSTDNTSSKKLQWILMIVGSVVLIGVIGLVTFYAQ